MTQHFVACGPAERERESDRLVAAVCAKAIGRAAGRPVTAAGQAARPVTILVDGPSGAGKTSLARELGAACGFEVIHLDDFYPGWSGLAQGAAAVARDVLATDSPGYTRWDWERDRPGVRVRLDSAASVVVEGVGALTAASLAAARRRGKVISIWVNGPRESRRRLALERDPYYEPWFEMWERQEREHWRRHPVGELDVDFALTWS